MTLLLTAVALLGFGAWYLLWRANRISELPTRRLFLVLFSFGLLGRLVFATFTPVFQAPDEEAHFRYIQYLAQNHSFPVQTSKTDAPTNDYEYYQPPLYYLLLTPVLMALGPTAAPIPVEVHVLRCFSILFWFLQVWLVWQLLVLLRIRNRFVTTFVLATTCLLPTYVYLSSTINNDNLVIPLSTAVLFLLARNASLRNTLLAGVVLGSALLAKLSAGVLVFVVLAQMAARRRERFQKGIVVLGIAALLFAPWSVRNVMLYGDPTAESACNVPILRTHVLDELRHSANEIIKTFWAVAGRHNELKFQPAPTVYATYLGLAACLWAAFRRRGIPDNRGSRIDPILVLSWTAGILAAAILVLRFGYLYGMGQGRHLYPMLFPISYFLAKGIMKSCNVRLERNAPIHAAGFFITYLLTFQAFCLAALLRA